MPRFYFWRAFQVPKKHESSKLDCTTVLSSSKIMNHHDWCIHPKFRAFRMGVDMHMNHQIMAKTDINTCWICSKNGSLIMIIAGMGMGIFPPRVLMCGEPQLPWASNYLPRARSRITNKVVIQGFCEWRIPGLPFSSTFYRLIHYILGSSSNRGAPIPGPSWANPTGPSLRSHQSSLLWFLRQLWWIVGLCA